MKQQWELFVPVGAIAIVILIAKPWSQFTTLKQLWQQRQQYIAAGEPDESAEPRPTIVQLGHIQGQVIHDVNGNGRADQVKTVVYHSNSQFGPSD